MNYFPTILEPKGSVSFLLVLSFFFPFPFFLFVFFFQWFLRVEQENFNLRIFIQSPTHKEIFDSQTPVEVIATSI